MFVTDSAGAFQHLFIDTLRIMQGGDSVGPRVRGAGWIEECGVFNVSDYAELESVGADEISECLRSLSVTG